MPEIIKTIVSYAGAVVSISAALTLIVKPLRKWAGNAIKKACGISTVDDTISSIREEMSELKGDTKAMNEKLDSLISMVNVQHKSACDSLRGMMLEIYYRYLPYEAIPSIEAEQFAKLADDYIALGGNSFMTDTVIPTVKKWQVITDLNYFRGVSR